MTRAYLSAVWNDPGVAFFIAGGYEGVPAIVHDAEKAGYPNVFGLIDRDFRRSNAARWSNPGKTFRTFVLPVHEIENYLLDAEALVGTRFNNVKKTQAEIETLMTEEASRRVMWTACRKVVALLRHRFQGHFLTDPRSVSTEAEALAHICENRWYQSLSRRTASLTEARIRRLLARAHAMAERMLLDGTWRSHFAGKEILHHVGSRIFDRTKAPRYAPSPAEFHADLAKEIAAGQTALETVPADLSALLSALKARIAR